MWNNSIYRISFYPPYNPGESELHQPDFRKLPKKQKNDT